MSGVAASTPGGDDAGDRVEELGSGQDLPAASQHDATQRTTSSISALETQTENAATSAGGGSASQQADTSASEHGGKHATAHTTHDASRHDEAPACLLGCRDRVEACSHRLQAWSDEKELQARERKIRRRDNTDGGVRIEDDGRIVEPKGDGIVQRKGIIVLVAVILSWVYVAYGWRVCANAIRGHANATATRREGIGMLVAFNILWLMTIWSYIRVITTAPGYVRDHIPITDPPTAPQEDEFRFPHSVLPIVQAPQQQQLQRLQQPQSIEPHSDATPLNGDAVTSTLAAAVGPIGAGLASRAEEAVNMQDALSNNVNTEVIEGQPLDASVGPAKTEEKQIPAPTVMMDVLAPTPFYPEPVRMPRTAKPLHPSTTYCYRCRRNKPPRAHHCRHCGTCVLKMDHHCPWVGGCVGARNHKFFYHFLQWTTLLEVFVLITNAIMFRRGVVRPGWSVDGYMISLFPISAVFAIFTTSLIVMHTYLFAYNMSTIEHMGYERQKTREDILIDNYLCDRREREGTPTPSWLAQTRERHAIKAKWDEFWGAAKTENNPWWLDGRRAPILVTLPLAEDVAAPDAQQHAAVSMDRDVVQRVTLWQALGTNWREAMGDSVLGWMLPIGRARNANGLQYDGNWRFGRLGEWTPRMLWASRLPVASVAAPQK